MAMWMSEQGCPPGCNCDVAPSDPDACYKCWQDEIHYTINLHKTKEKYNIVIQNIRNNLTEYINNGNVKALVLGVSGGIDSAVCAALARPVCDELNIPLIGISLPTEHNKEDEKSRARLIGERFCTEFTEYCIDNEYSTLKNMCKVDQPTEKIRAGNIQARIRMIYLYDKARERNGIVLSTDNLTEYYLGFWTLHGDVGDYGMIQGLWKTEVYELAEEIRSHITDDPTYDALNYCIKAVPTDGLGVADGGDLEQFGVSSYAEIDEIMQAWLGTDTHKHPLGFNGLQEHPIVQRFFNTSFKRQNPYDIQRDDIFDDVPGSEYWQEY
jgi:nicotinamide-nucleotide amidase